MSAPEGMPDTREGRYSQARIDGTHVQVSGMVGCDEAFEPVGGDIATQARQAFANLERILAEIDLGSNDVSMVTSDVVDAKATYPAYEPVFMDASDVAPSPCHAAVGTEETVVGEFLVEIEVEAWLDASLR